MCNRLGARGGVLPVHIHQVQWEALDLSLLQIPVLHNESKLWMNKSTNFVFLFSMMPLKAQIKNEILRNFPTDCWIVSIIKQSGSNFGPKVTLYYCTVYNCLIVWVDFVLFFEILYYSTVYCILSFFWHFFSLLECSVTVTKQ